MPAVAIPSHLRELRAVKQATRAFVETAGLRPQDSFDFVLAVHEIVSNAIVHGNGGDAAKQVTVELELRGRQAVATIRDQGHGFDHAAALAEARRRPDSPGTSGWGLLLVGKLVDRLEFTDGGSTVTLRKAIPPPEK